MIQLHADYLLIARSYLEAALLLNSKKADCLKMGDCGEPNVCLGLETCRKSKARN